MKITTIQYKKVFPIGAYQNEPLGIEATLDENEDPIEAFKTLKQLAHEVHISLNPTLYSETFVSNQWQQEPTPTLSTEEMAIKEIEQITDPKQLEAEYTILAKNNDAIRKAYDLQMLKLKNQ